MYLLWDNTNFSRSQPGRLIIYIKILWLKFKIKDKISLLTPMVDRYIKVICIYEFNNQH